MDTIKETQTIAKDNSRRSSHVSEAAGALLNEGKRLANEIYEDGLHKVAEVEDDVKEYSDQLLKKVQDNPLTSVLIAGGIGFLLSTLFKK